MVAGFQGGGRVLKPLKWYAALASVSGRRESGYFLAEGIRSIRQIYATSPQSIDELLLLDTADSLPEELYNIPQRAVNSLQLKTICSSVTPQGVAAVVQLPSDIYSEHLPRETGNRIILLEDVQDPGNIGTLIRTAAAFAIDGILMSDKCADPFSPKVVQATAGSLFRPWIRRTGSYTSLLTLLKTEGYRLYCADISGEQHVDFSGKEKTIIALGNEGKGISSGLLACADEVFSIPMEYMAVESLNVSIAGGIALFALFRNNGW
jgi:RNA methyltransferase, TrmH family